MSAADQIGSQPNLLAYLESMRADESEGGPNFPASRPEEDDPASPETQGPTADHDAHPANPASAPTEVTGRPRARLIRLSDVTPVEVSWLWQGFIPIGKLTLLVGDPGLGKSFISLDIAARTTTGRAWPDGSSPGREPGSVILISAEDGLADTIAVRLVAAGADAERISFFDHPFNEEGTPELFSLRKHIPHLEWAVRERGDTKLIVIDPLTSFGGGVNERSQGAVREMLRPLADMAERLGVAVLVISHPNKMEGGKAAYRTTGSLAYNAIARAVWFVLKDPTDGARRLLLPVKNNLAPDSKGLAYGLDHGKVEWEPGPVYISVDEALAAEVKARQRPGEEDRAVAFLDDLLGPGAMWQEHVVERGRQAGLSERTLDRAKREAKVGSKRLSTDQGARWFWHLPGRAPSSLDECQIEDGQREAGEGGTRD